jgi:hypothetical protein
MTAMHSGARQNRRDPIPVAGGTDDAARALANGPVGAFVVAGIAAGLLFAGWLAFYFLLFIPRGTIG